MLFSGKVVLIVDDSYTIRHQVRLLLKKLDIIVLEAFDKPSMIHNLRHEDTLVDLIIMDLKLKGTSGYDLMHYLQKMPQYKNIPLIILTGDATKHRVIETGVQFPIAYYAIKPIVPGDLSRKILDVLEQQHFAKLPVKTPSDDLTSDAIASDEIKSDDIASHVLPTITKGTPKKPDKKPNL